MVSVLSVWCSNTYIQYLCQVVKVHVCTFSSLTLIVCNVLLCDFVSCLLYGHTIDQVDQLHIICELLKTYMIGEANNGH